MQSEKIFEGIEIKEIYSSVAQAKSKFASYLSRAAYANEKIVITKRGKPLAAIISIQELDRLKSMKQSEGLKCAINMWENFEDIKTNIEEAYNKRSQQKGRDVSF